MPIIDDSKLARLMIEQLHHPWPDANLALVTVWNQRKIEARAGELNTLFIPKPMTQDGLKQLAAGNQTGCSG